jgi:adenylate cyclase
MPAPDVQRKLSAIMFTDIVNYTKMMEHNEAETMAFLNFHNTLLHIQITENGGKVVKTVGDAFLADFPSAVNAVRCAVSIQKHMFEHNRARNENRQLRIGIHVGDVVISNNDIFGDGVNIAARLYALAEPGGICISEDVYHHIKSTAHYKVVKMGPQDLKNVSRKVVTYKIVTDALGKRKPGGGKGFGIFLMLAGLAVLGGWYYSTLPEGKAWLAKALALANSIPGWAPTPTYVPSPTPTVQLVLTPTPTPTATPTATVTPTPTATPRPMEKHPVVKKKPAPKVVKHVVRMAPTPTEIPIDVPEGLSEAPPKELLTPVPTLDLGLAPSPTTTEAPLP